MDSVKDRTEELAESMAIHDEAHELYFMGELITCLMAQKTDGDIVLTQNAAEGLNLYIGKAKALALKELE